MASAWTYPTPNSAYSLPKPSRRRSRVSVTCSNWKSRVAALMKRALNMSSCSQQSRVLLSAMRSQLKVALEERELTATRTAASPSASGTPSSATSSSSCSSSYSSIVSCNNCGGFMVQPVCIPCGHSVCKGCMDKSTMLRGENLVCPKCNHTCPKIPRAMASSGEGSDSPTSLEKHRMPTLTLQNAFCKWYPKWVESTQCREEGNKYANQSDFVSAIHWYTQALETGVCDYRVLGNRSRSYLAVEKLDEACQDAELACRLHPFWAKGHYRRGAVLERQGCWRQAIAAYLLCLHLGGSDQLVVKAACQLLDKNISEAEKKLLSGAVKEEAGMCADSVSPCAEASPSSPSPPCSSLSCCHSSLLSGVVELAVQVMAECVEVEEAMREETQALVAPAPPGLVDISDFECVLCTGLLYDPVTTPCGHSFCRSCLCRSFDHSPSCPVCRLVLIESFQQHCQNLGKMGVDLTLEGVLLHYFHDAYMEKRSQVTSEIQKSLIVGTSETETLPVFVCTMAYPGLACPLHIFEPRYRLMVRRCVESGSKRFGMCQPAATGGGSVVSFADYGTVLHISNVEQWEDGRSLISTQGERRFKVLERGMKDGYHTAKIMFLFDERVTEKEEIASLRALQQETYDHAKRWLDNAPFFSRMMMMQVVTTPLPEIDPVPECCPNGPKWVWWFIHALPTTPTRKLDFLKCMSLRDRLHMLKELLPLPDPTTTAAT